MSGLRGSPQLLRKIQSVLAAATAVRPEAGLLVVFRSFFYYPTAPLEFDEERTNIAIICYWVGILIPEPRWRHEPRRDLL
jgi:hypothetical protein